MHAKYMNDNIKFSVVIPTYNEQADIAGTLDAVLAMDFPDFEILVVDDSIDETPNIVNTYIDRGVRLIKPGGGGRCEARNKGILAAKGDIVCILNADVRLPNDFFQRLLPHYAAGFDFVVVDSKVSNMDRLFARYVDCAFAELYNENTNPEKMDWSEGFTCKRNIAIEAGLFPTGGIVPIVAGEDGYFGQSLRKVGAIKKIDLSICVEHVSPANFSEYWRIRKGRGEGSSQVHKILDHWSYLRLFFWNAAKSAYTLIFGLSLFPVIVKCVILSKRSPNKYYDIFPFIYAWTIEATAFHLGEWSAYFKMLYLDCFGVKSKPPERFQ